MPGNEGILVVPQAYNWAGNGANDAWAWGQDAALEIWAVDPTNPALNGLVWDGPGLLARDPANVAAIIEWVMGTHTHGTVCARISQACA